jgi:hypothetical protein
MFDVLKNLFPRSRAFQLFIDNQKRKLVKGLSVLLEDVRHEAELVYFDLFPDTTRFPSMWEKVFSLLFTKDELKKRRDVLDSLWKINANSGQSKVFLEEILQNIDSNINVIENIPVGNPRDSNVVLFSINKNPNMVCGNKKAVCGYRIGDSDFIPYVLQNDTCKLYDIPDDRNFWGFCFYIGGNVVRNNKNEILYISKIKVDSVWKNYIEYLILKVKPVHTTAVLFIEWKQETNNDQN